MNSTKQKVLRKVNLKFKEELEYQKKFFSKPDVLIALSVLGVSMLRKFLDKNSEDVVKKFLKHDKIAKSFLNYTANNLNEQILSEFLLKCQNGEISEEEFLTHFNKENISAEDFLNIASTLNDFETKLNFDIFNKLKSFMNKNQNVINNTLSYLYLLYHIVLMTIDMIQNAEYPSKFRTKYIQLLNRNLAGVMKSQWNEVSQQIQKEWKKIIKILKQIDTILIALTMATSMYLINRKILQKRSYQTLQEIAKDKACINLSQPFDISVNIIPFKENLNCPIELDDVIVSHVPIEGKLKNISCEISLNEEIISNAKETTNLVTKAIIRNICSDKMNVLVSIDSKVNQKTLLATIGNTQIISPILGYIDNLQTNQIIIRDISDPSEDYLTSQINSLNEKYTQINDIKFFIKNFYVASLYPVMLKTSIIDDTSIRDINVNVKTEFEIFKKNYKELNKNYEKDIKDIVQKDNVEKNAKNETLFKIKEDVENKENIFYKNIELIGQNSYNIAKATAAKKEEYQLIEYYLFDLGTELNALSNPNKIEITFRNLINEYAQKRYVIDKYKKTNIEKKIGAYINDIEKNISFDDIIRIYNAHKQFSDVKKWLIDIANKNNKLEQFEKNALVNKIMFLIEFYFTIDEVVSKKYIEVKTNSKNETIKEGNEIDLFFRDLQKQFNALLKKIEDIQKTIDNLSLFNTTYSITNYEEENYRLYTISEPVKCKPTEEDINLDPNTKYDFGNIKYWLRYCSYATLASVSNSVTGWATGFIFPTPILFPVVYIPIKSILTKYGFIVIGLSICGLYIFPWSLFVNYSINYALPFFDPTIALKNEIEALKKGISEQLAQFRKITIKRILDKTKEDLDEINNEISNLKDQLNQNKIIKPQKLIIEKNAIKKNSNYFNEHKIWTQKNIELQELIATTSIKKWKIEQKYEILNNAYRTNTSIKEIDKKLKDEEKLITDQLDKLNNMVDNVDEIIAPLPITLKPETVNFGMTLKNPKPLIKIKDQLNDNINEEALNNVFNKFN